MSILSAILAAYSAYVSFRAETTARVDKLEADVRALTLYRDTHLSADLCMVRQIDANRRAADAEKACDITIER